MKSKRVLAGIVLTVFLLGIVLISQKERGVVSAASLLRFWGINYETELSEGKYYEMVDENGSALTMTALPVHIGDEFWTADNKHYKVTKVRDNVAYAKCLGTEDIAWKAEWDDIPVATSIPVQGEQKDDTTIGIYHTHSDESYSPTDGTSSIRANGGIFKVGNVLSEKLKSMGFNVYHDKTPHDPHDAGAYHRSRRTAVKLLKKQPTVQFDVHRDAVPASVYAAEIGGQAVTKIKLVVGRQNQNKQANLEFAKTMKAAMDKTNPGLFEGIFLAKGNYNQDLGPRMMLIEVGSDTNSREEAQKGVALFADAVPKALGVYQNKASQPGTKQISAPDANRSKSGSWPAIWWLLGAVVVGGIAFLVISTGSFGGSWKKIKEFTGSEFGKRRQK
ncbi:MAG: stage II sporulation protein P [Desulfitobacteriaceae bacterium]|nr:stage II sporulation protein P [Desulfitobacteriaceae bacterium]MDD4751754.1 stage II sporulation protein P [Desulfitobacteriaceae bacterium]